MDLPQLVMRRAGVVALAVLVLALVLGLARMRTDINDEFDAASHLASLIAQLAGLARADDATALATLVDLRTKTIDQASRHLRLGVQAADGRPLLQAQPPVPDPAPLRALLALHRRLASLPEPRAVAWALPRPDGTHWTVTLEPWHEGERREALLNLLGTLALLLLCISGLLLAMRWNVRRAMAPLGRLLALIRSDGGLDAQALRALPRMPIDELVQMTTALLTLASALDDAEARRRLLSQQVLSLQEDERARLARELHDELGQRLTALRVDATWLARRLAGQPALSEVVQGMAEQCAGLQQDIRGLLAQLQPFDNPREGVSLARLLALLRGLGDSWAASGRNGGFQLKLDLPPVDGDQQASLRLPQALALALYRISQEALTNVARHAQASQAALRLQWQGEARPGGALQLSWSVQDDGVGLPAAERVLNRGNGIAGIQERVWALGGDLQMQAASAQAARPGLRLSAQIQTHWLAALAATPGQTAGD